MEPLVLTFERGKDIFGWTATRKTVRLLENARDAAWSPDGKQLAFVRDGALWTTPLAAPNAVRRLCRLPGKPEYPGAVTEPTLSWHPTKPLIAFSCQASKASSLLAIFVVSSKGGEPQVWIDTAPPRLGQHRGCQLVSS